MAGGTGIIASWSHIWFDDLPYRHDERGLGAILTANHGGFRLQLTAARPQTRMTLQDPSPPGARAAHARHAAEVAATLPRTDAIDVALVTGERRIASPTSATPFTGGTSGAGVTQHAETWRLPWPDDPLADLWLAVRIDDTHYAVALPYGVCRDEARALGRAPVPPTQPPAGERRAWRGVDYEYFASGALRVRVRAAAAEPGVLELVLYHEHDPWREPPVSVTGGRPLEAWRRFDAMRHAARFAMTVPPPPSRAPRFYAPITVRIAGHDHTLVVPSSLLTP